MEAHFIIQDGGRQGTSLISFIHFVFLTLVRFSAKFAWINMRYFISEFGERRN